MYTFTSLQLLLKCEEKGLIEHSVLHSFITVFVSDFLKSVDVFRWSNLNN